MFCIKCYTSLDADAQCAKRCPWCGRGFDPADSATYLRRPFPSCRRIAAQLIGTTIVGIVVAFVVAFFQMAQASGH